MAQDLGRHSPVGAGAVGVPIPPTLVINHKQHVKTGLVPHASGGPAVVWEPHSRLVLWAAHVAAEQLPQEAGLGS